MGAAVGPSVEVGAAEIVAGVSDWECPGGCGWVFGHKRRCFRCGVPRDGGGDGFGGGHRDGPGHTRF